MYYGYADLADVKLEHIEQFLDMRTSKRRSKHVDEMMDIVHQFKHMLASPSGREENCRQLLSDLWDSASDGEFTSSTNRALITLLD
jgi:hypothetical protein